MTKKPKNRKTKKPKNRAPFLGFFVFRFFGSHAGFTLVEILIVSMIVSILAAGLGSSFVSGMRLWGRASQQDMTRFNAWLTLEAIGKELRQSAKVPVAPFKGEASRCSFPSIIGGSIVEITYRYDGYEKRIRREEVAFKDLVEETLEPPTKTRVVFAPAQEFVIEYAMFDPAQLDEDGNPKGYEWVSEWESDEGAIPAAVRITMKVRNATLIKIIFLPIA